jgi:aryl-alcohol dehydrogenase-like predicted oxidoreductase
MSALRDAVEYMRLGRAGVKVSRLCLGTNNFGVQVDEATTRRIIAKAVDLGVNIIDTANMYTGGRSEELIGRAIGGNREDLVIATKAGMTLDQGKPNSTGLSRKHLIWQLNESLRRLQTDYIDLFYLHRFDPETSLEETLTTMDNLVRMEKVRYVGVSNFTAEQLREVDRVCESLGLEKPVAVQPEYSLLKREIEADLLPECERMNLAVLTYSPLAGGFLTGKYRADQDAPPPGTRAAARKWYWERIRAENRFADLERFQAAAAAAGVSLRQLALAWVVRNRVVTSAIVGASVPEQVEENALALELKLDEKTMASV